VPVLGEEEGRCWQVSKQQVSRLEDAKEDIRAGGVRMGGNEKRYF